MTELIIMSYFRMCGLWFHIDSLSWISWPCMCFLVGQLFLRLRARYVPNLLRKYMYKMRWNVQGQKGEVVEFQKWVIAVASRYSGRRIGSASPLLCMAMWLSKMRLGRMLLINIHRPSNFAFEYWFFCLFQMSQ